ncbi:MAG: hypothetical protein J6J87_08705, partial [Oscillospiraceae bacterium]|nr:hypothetical protein [Oscillospiraceae bacterium]
KFVSMFLALVMCLSIPVFASEEKPSYNEDYINAKFEELFPEYQEYIQSHDDAVAQAQSAPVSAMSLALEDVPEVTETVTRMDGDDIYSLSLLSDGGYAKIALVSGEYSEASWSGGTVTDLHNNGARWNDRKITAYISSGGVFPYTGGMIGDGITYTLTAPDAGYFPSSGTMNERWGNYRNAGVYPGYEDDIGFILMQSNRVQVQGVATYYALIGEMERVLTKYTVLTIDLTKRENGAPLLTFNFQ